MKEHDYFLEAINNPTFSAIDFNNVGLTAENTSFESADTYKKLDYIQQNPLFQTNNKFDPVKFDNYYLAAADGFKHLTEQDYTTAIANQFSYFRGNVLAPKEQKIQGPEYTIGKEILGNPKRQKISAYGYNQWGDPSMSTREIAESNKTYDVLTNQWVDSPNDQGFFGNLFDTKVLAQYDQDVDINDNPTSDPTKIVHHKGDLKLNYKGEPYYETLGNRSVYGRQVLSAFNTITVDGSSFNKYDFFDSDDLDKSTAGTLVKNIVKVAPAFIPYVGPWYIAARVSLESANLFAKVGKMIAGSDNETLSAIEGFTKAMTMDQSDFASEHPWRLENLLNMGADVFTQLAEQRFMFQYLPSIMRGNSLGWSKKAQESFREAERAKFLSSTQDLKQSIMNIENLRTDSELVLGFEGQQLARATAEANAKLESILKSNYDLGKYISRTYMTGVTTAESYAEAKEQGASDLEAALFTLGYSAAEYGILTTNLGEWFLPELRLEKQRIKAIIRNLQETNPQPSANAPKEIKAKWMRKIIDTGKKFFEGEYTAKPDKASLALTAEHLIANAIGEGIEEVSEEALQDLSKTFANAVYYLNNSQTHIRPTWEDEEGHLDFSNTLNDYALNFVGGFIGGGIGQAHQSYKQARSIKNLGPNNSAFQELLYLIREGEADKIIKVSRKMAMGDINLSPNVNSQGIFESGTKTENQNTAAHTQFENYVRNLQDILNSVGAKDRHGLLNDLTLKELRFTHLLNSTVAASYMQQYHSLLAETVSKYQQIQNIQNDKSSDSAQLTEQQQADIQRLQSEISENQKKLEEYYNGTQSKEFIRDAIFEMTYHLSNGYIPSNVIQYIAMREERNGTRRELEAIPQETLDKYKTDWATFKDSELPDRIRTLRKLFDSVNVKVSDKIKNFAQTYIERAPDNAGTQFETEGLNIETVIVNERDATKQINGFEQYLGDSNYTNLSRDIIFTRLLLKNLALSSPDGDTLNYYETLLNLFSNPNVQETVDDDTLWALLSNNSLPNTYNYIHTQLNANDIVTLRNNLSNTGLLSIMYNDIKNAVLNSYYNEIINELKSPSYIKASVKQYMTEYFDKSNLSTDQKQHIKDTINTLKSSPFDELMDEFQISLDDSSIKVTQLISHLEESLNQGILSISLHQFGYDQTTSDAIDHALQLIKVIQSHLAAARIDAASYSDSFGYNKIVNEFEGTDLAEINTSVYSLLSEDLQKTQIELLFYQTLYQLNSGQKIKDEQKIGTKLAIERFRMVKQKFTVNIPDTWKDKQKFLNIINDLENSILGNLSNEIERGEGHKVRPLSEQEEIQLLHDQIVLSNAIYDFLNANQDKELTEIFNLQNFGELIAVNDDEISLKANKQFSYRSFINWLAATATVRYDNFLKLYSQILNDAFLPLSGQMSLLFHEYAFAQRQFWYDKVGKVINSITEGMLAGSKSEVENRLSGEGGLSIHKEIVWEPNSGKNNQLSVRYSHTFLGEGGPGTGKSTANYIYLLKLLEKSNSSLFNKKIFIIHRSKDGAERIINDLVNSGFNRDFFVSFSHYDYLRYINDNHKGFIVTNGIQQIDQDKLTQNNDQTWHYNYEGDFNQGIEIPSLVFIDEITNMSELDLAMHERFVAEQNIRSFGTGDFKQSTVIGQFPSTNGGTEQIAPGRNNFIGTGRLATSMRTNNLVNDDDIGIIEKTNDNLKSIIIEALQNATDADGNFDPDLALDQIFFTYDKLRYVENEAGLFGIKFTESFDEYMKQSIINMLNALKPNEKVTFIYKNSDTSIFNYLTQLNESGEYKDKIAFREGSAQGDEGQFYILDLDIPENLMQDSNSASIAANLSKYLDDFYTSISRASQGTLVLTPSSNLLGLNSLSVENEGTFNIDQRQKREANERIKRVIKEATKGIEHNEEESLTKVEEEQKEELSGAPISEDVDNSDEELENSSDNIPVIQNNQQRVTNAILHSFNTLNTGLEVYYDENGNPILKFNEETFTYLQNELSKTVVTQRNFKNINTNGLNGLALLLGFDALGGVNSDRTLKNPQLAIKILNQVRYALKYGKTIEEIKSLMPHPRLKQANIDFIYKSYRYDEKHNDNKFKHSPNERLIGLTGVDLNERSKAYEPRNKGITAAFYINGIDGSIFETQVFSFPNILSMLDSLEIREEFEKWRSNHSIGQLSEFASHLSTLFTGGKNKVRDTQLWSAIRLINIFIENEDNVIPLENFIPARDLKLTGLSVISHDKGKAYFYNTDYEFTYTTQNVGEILNGINPIYSTSNVFALHDDFKIGDKVIVKAGKAFILISENPKYGTNNREMLTAYINQELNRKDDNDFHDDIKLILVNSPADSINIYLTEMNKHFNKNADIQGNINNNSNDSEEITEENGGYEFLGNSFTNFRMLQMLVNSSEFSEVLEGQIGKDNEIITKRWQALKYLIDYLTKIEANHGIKRVKQILTGTVNDLANLDKSYFGKSQNDSDIINASTNKRKKLIGYGNQKRVGSLLSRNLWQFLFRAGQTANVIKVNSQVIIDAASQVLENNNWQGVFYHIPLKQGEQIDIHLNDEVYQVLTLNTQDWAFRFTGEDVDQNLKMTGKVDATMAVGDINGILNTIENQRNHSHEVHRKGGLTKYEQKYLGQNTQVIETPTPKVVQNINNLTDFKNALNQFNLENQRDILNNLPQKDLQAYIKQMLEEDPKAVQNSINLQNLIFSKLVNVTYTGITWDFVNNLVLLMNENSGALFNYYTEDYTTDPNEMIKMIQGKTSNLELTINSLISTINPAEIQISNEKIINQINEILPSLDDDSKFRTDVVTLINSFTDGNINQRILKRLRRKTSNIPSETQIIELLKQIREC